MSPIQPPLPSTPSPPLIRPLGHRAYGSIPHLPGSRTGPADRHLAWPLARRCIDPRLSGQGAERVLVQEKLDGSCVAVARLGDQILALGRAGDLAERSASPMRRLFAAWVAAQGPRFLAALADGERFVGEWLALAHGTRYALRHEPFVVFDLMRGHTRAPSSSLRARAAQAGLTTAALLHEGGPLAIPAALDLLGSGRHGALDPVEGAVWRVEPDGRVEIVAKYVRPDKRDGCLLTEVTGAPPVWNWHPARPEGPEGRTP